MSDTGLTTDTAPSSPDPPVSATPPPAAPAPSAGVDDDPFAALPDDQAVFSRGWVDKIRNEGQRYREQAKAATARLQTYDDVYGAYADEDRQVWFQLAQTWAQDPAQAAAVMRDIATGVLGDTQPVAPEPAQEFTDVDEAIAQTLTPEQVQGMIAEQFAARDASAQEQRAIQDVFAEVRAAGFDPESTDGFMVLYNANHFTNFDIAKAAEMVKARDQKIIDDYVAGRSGRPMVSPAGGVVATPAPQEIKSIEDARRATDAFLRERRGAS